ncbi:hypothetical protein PENTCL1PPCAC_26338, partial [Pristionchus entomophagus]
YSLISYHFRSFHSCVIVLIPFRMSTEDLLVAELRSLVSSHLSPYYDTHFNLLRWIQAHPGVSVDKIADRLRHHLLYRACSWEIDGIHQKERGYHPIHRYWPRSKCGMSGVIPSCLVHVEQSGQIDFDGILDNFSIAEVMRARIFDIEEMFADVMQIEKETGDQSSVIYVMDAEGIEYTKKLMDLVLGSLRALSEFMADHYVELVKYFVIVNVPSWAYTLWLMIKPLLPERTRLKIILSTSNWRKEIHSLMDPSVGPSFWNDENHNEFKLQMERPPKVPRVEITEPAEKLEKLYVKAGAVQWIEYSLEKGDAIAFHVTGNANFGFTIVRAENEDEDDAFAMRQIYPLFSWMPGPLKVPIEDSVIVPESGVYKVWFSNSRAWWSSLSIQHNIKVIKNQ